MKLAARPKSEAPTAKRKPKESSVPAPQILEIIAGAEGHLLGDELRRDYEKKLGHNLRDVRIHDGPATAEAIEAMGVEAVTINQNVYFGRNRFQPETTEGRRLLAHELTHAIQQQGGTVAKSAPTPIHLEQEAKASEEAPEPIKSDPLAAGRMAARGFFGPLDPARLFDVLAHGIERVLSNDPDDARGNIRRQIGNLQPDLREKVTDNLRARMTDSETSRLDRVLEGGRAVGQETETPAEAPDLQQEAPEAPQAAPEAKEHDHPQPEKKQQSGKADITSHERKDAPEGAEEAPAATAPLEAKEVPPEEEQVVAEEPAAEEKGTGIAAGAAQASGAPAVVEDMPMAEGAPEKEEAEGEEQEQVRNDHEEEREQYHRDRVREDETARAETQAAEADRPAPKAATPEPIKEAPMGAIPAMDIPEVDSEPAPEPEPDPEPQSTEVADLQEAGHDVSTGPVDVDHGQVAAPDSAETAPAEAPAPNPDSADAAQAMGKCMGGGEHQAPPAEAGGEGGGVCGGGGGGAAPPESEAAAPAPAGNDPAAAIAAAGSLPPDQIPDALSGARSAANESVGAQREEIKGAPPSMDRPSGAPAGHGPVEGAAAPISSAAAVATLGSAGTGTKPEAGAAPEFAPPTVAPTPSIAGTPDGKLSPADVQNMQNAVDDLPTTDAALNVTAGEPPELILDGDADPGRTRDQRQEMNQGASEALADARSDAAQPMGENTVYPDVPPEKLEAKGSFSECVSGKSNSDPKPTKPESLVAQAEKADEIAGAAQTATGEIEAGRTQSEEDISAEKEKNQAEIDAAVEESDNEQTAARKKVKREVKDKRGEWNDAQDEKVSDAKKDADKAETDANTKITDQRVSAKKDAQNEVEKGNKDIKSKREEAETKAREEKKKSKKSSGWLDRIASAIKSLFNKIKGAIKAVFDAARSLVKGIINAVKKAAMFIIDKARNLIIAAIKAVGDILIAIGDVLLAAFPALREKFRKFITDMVDAATDLVNKIADGLKAAINALLDALLGALMAFLCALEALYLAAIDIVASVVAGVIAFAKAIVAGFGAFIEIVGDVAADPGGWLSKFGSAVVSGVKNCLWGAFKTAVKTWFNGKVESILGLGRLIWNILAKGCMTAGQIGQMAWQGLKAAIPMILVSILIEKLVSMLVPVAGGLITIIQALIAAWGTIQQIITAFQLFMTFLKAVKSGNAAGAFANAVAAAAVVVIDFVANWLIARLAGGAAKKIASGFKSMAKKFQAMFAKVAKAMKRGAKAAKKGVSKAVKKVGDTVKAIGRKVMKNKTVRRVMASKPIRSIRKSYANVKRKVSEYRERVRQWNERRKAKAKAERLRRLEQAVNSGASYANRFAGKQVSGLRLRAGLLPIMARYRILSLGPVKSGSTWSIRGRVNTEKEAGTSAKQRSHPYVEIELLEQRLPIAERRAFAEMGIHYGGPQGVIIEPGTAISQAGLGKAFEKGKGLNMTNATNAELMAVQAQAMGTPRGDYTQANFLQNIHGFGQVNVTYKGGPSGASPNPTWAGVIVGLGTYTEKGAPKPGGKVGTSYMGKLLGSFHKANISEKELSHMIRTNDMSALSGKGLTKTQLKKMIPQIVRMRHLDIYERTRSMVQAGIGREAIPTTFQGGETHRLTAAGQPHPFSPHLRSGFDESLSPDVNRQAREAGKVPLSHTIKGASVNPELKKQLNREFIEAYLVAWRAEEKAKLTIKIEKAGVEDRSSVPSIEELESRVKSHLHGKVGAGH